jgi:hypothetical protein
MGSESDMSQENEEKGPLSSEAAGSSMHPFLRDLLFHRSMYISGLSL